MASVIACTIVTKSHLAYARTLAQMLDEHNPGSTLYVLLADKIDGYFDPSQEPFKLVGLSDLGSPEIVEKMCFYYTPFELSCALRGLLHEYMLQKTTAPMWLFLDSDIMICHSFEPILEQLGSASILLSPHCTTPVQKDLEIKIHELNILRAGLYNGGILGLKRSEDATSFIVWFKKRLQSFGFQRPSETMFGDQLWLNLVPLFFNNVSLLTHPGTNVAYWNLYERDLSHNLDGKIMVNGKPLIFVHFSGWEISSPEQLTKWNTMYGERTWPLMAALGQEFRRKLLAAGYEKLREYPYAFSHFETGEGIPVEFRRLYHEELVKGRDCEGSPFSNYRYFTKRAQISRLKHRLRKLWPRS